jgi:hypothetical protein
MGINEGQQVEGGQVSDVPLGRFERFDDQGLPSDFDSDLLEATGSVRSGRFYRRAGRLGERVLDEMRGPRGSTQGTSAL